MSVRSCAFNAGSRFGFIFLWALLHPCHGQTVSDALDAPGLTWNNPAGTLVQNDVTHDGVDAVRLARTGTAALSTMVTGPAVLELQVRTSTEENADWFEAAVGDMVLTRLSGEQPWQKVTLDIPAGSQRVDLLYRKDAMTAHGADAVWVDAVRVTPGGGLTVAEAVDANFAGAVTVTTAAVEWFTLRTALLSVDGGDVLVLRATGTAAGGALLHLPVIGRGRLLFRAVSSGGTLAYVQATSPLRPVSYAANYFAGPGVWTTLEFVQPLDAPVPAAEVYFAVPAGSTVRVDGMRWTPWTGVSAGEALEAPALPWQLNGAVAAVGDAEVSHDGADGIAFYGAGGTVSLPVAGPVQLTWWERNTPALLLDERTVTPSLLTAETSGWVREALFVPPGAHVVRWRTAGTSATAYDELARLDEATALELTAVSLAEAADAPGLTWSVTGALGGFGGGVESVLGGDAIYATALPVRADDRVEAAGSGAARMDFAWRGAQTFALNGSDLISVTPAAAEWTRVSADLPEGAWTAQWRTRSSSAPVTPALDAVQVATAAGERLSDIAECSGGVKVRCLSGNHAAGPVAGWQGEPGRQLLMDGNPQLALVTEGSGVLRLRLWLTAGDFLSVPGGGTMSGTGAWQDVEWPVSGMAGQTALLLAASGSAGAVLAVDRIIWTTGATVETNEALDFPGVLWSTALTGATDGWLGRAAPVPASNPGDGDALVVPSLGTGASARLTTTITGDGWLTWAHLIPGNARLIVSVDGVTAVTYPVTSGWARGYAEISPGAPRVVEFNLLQNASGSAGIGAINDVGLRPWAAVDGTAAEFPPDWTLRTSPHRRFGAASPTTPDASHPSYLAANGTIAPAVLEAVIPGPGWLSFEARDCAFSLNGAIVQTLNSGFWQPVTLTVAGAGPHRLRWSTRFSQPPAVDLILFSAATAAPAVGEALEQPAWAWTVPAGWSTDVPAELAHDGVDCAVFSGPATSAVQLRAPWPGAGMLQFWWRGPGSADPPQLTFNGGGVSHTAPITNNWTYIFASLSAAAASDLVWETTATTRPGEHLRLDEVRFTPYSSISLAEALDTPGRAWSVPVPGWVTVEDPDGAGEANDYAMAPPVEANFFLETPVTLPVWLEYDTRSDGVLPEVQLNVPGATLSWMPVVPGPLLHRRVLVNGTGASRLSFAHLSHAVGAPSYRPRYLDRVFIGAPVSLAEALDSALPWVDETIPPGIAGVQMKDAVQGGDAALLGGGPPRVPSVTLTGPGEIALRWKGEDGNATLTTPAARLLLDGAEVRALPRNSGGWREVRHRLGAGTHTVKLEPEYGSALVLADDFRFTPGGTDEAAAALDMPSAQSGGEGWESVNLPGAQGGSALRTQPGAAQAALSLPLQGSGVLRFSWQLPLPDPPPPQVSLRLVLDGATAWTATAAADWQQVSLLLPRGGAHSLVWEWLDGTGAAQALLDQVSLTPFGAVALAGALETPGRTWTATNMDGVSAADAGFTGDDAVRFAAPAGVGELATAVTGPARIRFRWYQDVMALQGNLTFGVDGLFSYAPRTAGQWEVLEVDVPPGLHTVIWRGLSGWPGRHGGFLDDVQIASVTLPASAAAALDITGVTVAAGAGWYAVTRPSVRDDDALISTSDSTNVSLTLAGAGWFEFTCTQVAEWQPGISFSDSTSAALEQVWRQPGPSPGMFLIRYRLKLSSTTTRQLRLTRPGNSLGYFFMLDDCAWTPATPIPFAEALDSPGITWTSGGTVGWTGYPFLPVPPAAGSGVDASRDVAFVRTGGSESTATLTTTIEGPFSLALSGVNGGNVKLTVDGRSWSDGLAGTFYFLQPGTHTVRLAPAGNVTGSGLSVDSAVIALDPPPPALPGGFRAGSGVWRYTPGTAAALSSQVAAQEIKGTVTGPGALRCTSNGTVIVRTAGGLSASLTAGSNTTPYRIEFPAAGPQEVTFVSSGTVSELEWLPGAAALTAACGLQTPTVFGPAAAFSVSPGGALLVQAASTPPALIAIERTEAFLATWWQQTPSGGTVLNPGTLAPTAASVAEAGPAPPATDGMAWTARRQFRTPSAASFQWSLTGEVLLGNIRLIPQSLSLEDALDLPASVEAAAVAPGTVVTHFDPAYPAADKATLRAGVERALQLTATGPGILGFTANLAQSSPYFRVQVDALPPMDMPGGLCRLPLGPGPHTITLGGMPGTWLSWQLDAVTLMALPFDPVAALGGVSPLLITNGEEPALWPLVLSAGADTAMHGGFNFYTATTGAARFSFNSTYRLFAGTRMGQTNWSSVRQPGVNALWTAGPATLWLEAIGGSSVPESPLLSGLRLEHVPAPAPGLAAALEAPGLTFTAAPGVIPHGLASGSVFGGDAVAFGMGAAPRSVQTAPLTGPGVLRFHWRTLTPGETTPSLSLTGAGLAQSYNSTTWKHAEVVLPAGSSTPRWSTTQPNVPADCAELDRVEWFPQWTFDTWAAQNALASLPTAAARAADDSDGDGAAGLLEFAFGLDPGVNDAAVFTGALTGAENARGLPALKVGRALNGQDFLELHFPRRLNSGLTIQMQAAATPAGPWLPTGTIEVLRPLGADFEMCRIRDALPLDPAARARRFVRLLLSQP